MLQPAPNSPQNDAESVPSRAQRAKAAAPDLVLDPSWLAGRKLAEARRQQGLSLDQVAERIRVRREILEAIEAMNVKLLPGKAYTLAFLRSYARELGVEEKAIVDQFQQECALTRDEGQKLLRDPSSRPHRERPWMAALALLAVAAAFVGWRTLQPAAAPEAVQQEAAALESSAPAHPMAEDARRVVEIRALGEAWLEARGPDGTVFFSRTLQEGDVYRPDASPGWTLHARDGGAFELFVNGAPAGPLGAAGMPVLGRGIDEIQPTAQAGLAPPRS